MFHFKDAHDCHWVCGGNNDEKKQIFCIKDTVSIFHLEDGQNCDRVNGGNNAGKDERIRARKLS